MALKTLARLRKVVARMRPERVVDERPVATFTTVALYALKPASHGDAVAVLSSTANALDLSVIVEPPYEIEIAVNIDVTVSGHAASIERWERSVRRDASVAGLALQQP